MAPTLSISRPRNDMKGKILLITIIAALDAFLVFFAIGFNSKHALVEDPSLPPVDMEKVRKSVEEREAKPKKDSGKNLGKSNSIQMIPRTQSVLLTSPQRKRTFSRKAKRNTLNRSEFSSTPLREPTVLRLVCGIC